MHKTTATALPKMEHPIWQLYLDVRSVENVNVDTHDKVENDSLIVLWVPIVVKEIQPINRG